MSTDHVPTTDFGEVQRLLGDGWEQVCNAFYGRPALCATGDPTGDGPFQLFNAPGPDRTPIHRCFSGADHFLSPDPGCEGRAFEGLLGYAATTRTSSAPRALSRCFHAPASAHFHWLADRCPTEKPGVAHESVLGYVR